MQGKIRFVGLALLACAVAGCATTTTTSRRAPNDAGAQQFVDAQMSQALNSIDNSLKTLVILDRGGEAPRKPGPIGSTVAGAAGPSQAPLPAPVSRVSSVATADASILSKRARIQWRGAPSQLLATLAKNVGYMYEEVGSGAVSQVNIPDQEMSVRELLSKTAAQIEGQADIRVDTVTRRIQLIHR